MINTGNEDLLNHSLTAFLCSRRCPDETVAAVDEWINSLNPETDCIVCGGHSGMEKRAVVKLIEKGIPLVWYQVNNDSGKWKDLIEKAISENRLLLITAENGDNRTTLEQAVDRNENIISLANNIVVAYMDKGGKLEKELQNSQAEIKILVEQKDIKNDYYCIRRDGGNIYIDMERGMSSKFFRISQSRNTKNGETKRECVFINARELPQLKKAVEWAMEQAGLNNNTNSKPKPRNQHKKNYDQPQDDSQQQIVAEQSINDESNTPSESPEPIEEKLTSDSTVIGKIK